MLFLRDGIWALLACIGLSAVLWGLIRALLFPPSALRGAVILISARNDGEGLEHKVRALRFLPFRGSILVVDCGLTEEGRRLGRLIARMDRRVILCGSDEITTYITDKENLL